MYTLELTQTNKNKRVTVKNNIISWGLEKMLPIIFFLETINIFGIAIRYQYILQTYK